MNRRTWLGSLAATVGALLIPRSLAAATDTPSPAPSPWDVQKAYRGVNSRGAHIFALPANFTADQLQLIADYVDQKFGRVVSKLISGPRARRRYLQLLAPISSMYCGGGDFVDAPNIVPFHLSDRLDVFSRADDLGVWVGSFLIVESLSQEESTSRFKRMMLGHNSNKDFGNRVWKTGVYHP